MKRASRGNEGAIVVLDTNVVLDWLVFADPALAALDAALASGTLRWLANARMQAELAHVLRRGTLARWSPDAEGVIATALARAEAAAEAPPCGLVCTDPDDQMFIDLALQHRARWLVTRDLALLRLAAAARTRGTTICTPAAWQPSTALASMRTALAAPVIDAHEEPAMPTDPTPTTSATDAAAKQALATELDVTLQQIDEAIAAVGSNRSDIELHLKGSRSSTTEDRMQQS